jgi:F-type H+-transporting ATPase subunit alpha
MSLEDMVLVMFAGTNGFADAVPVEKMGRWQTDLLKFMGSSFPEIGREITDRKTITEEARQRLTGALETFRETWKA